MSAHARHAAAAPRGFLPTASPAQIVAWKALWDYLLAPPPTAPASMPCTKAASEDHAARERVAVPRCAARLPKMGGRNHATP
jgi:hypothetical protein